MSPFVARNGHPSPTAGCLLSGVKRKSASASSTSEFDPERTWRLGSKREFHLASRLQFLWKQTMIDELMQRSWDLLFPRQTYHRAVPRFQLAWLSVCNISLQGRGRVRGHRVNDHDGVRNNRFRQCDLASASN